jgi:hypothetical protein
MNFPGGAYQVSHYIEDVDGGYHDYEDGARIVIVAADPRVVGDYHVDLELQVHAPVRCLTPL